MKTIWYAIVDSIEVSDEMDDNEIEKRINDIADGKEVIWSDRDDLFNE